MLNLLKNSISSLNTESSTTSNSMIKDNNHESNPINSHKLSKINHNNDSKILSSSVDQNHLNALMPNLQSQSVKKAFDKNSSNTNEIKVKIRSSSKAKHKVKDEIIKDKFVNHSVEKNIESSVQKQKIVMGQTTGNFFKRERMSATSDSFFGSTRNQQNSF